MVYEAIKGSDKILGWIAAILLFLLIRPYFVWAFVDMENWYAVLPLYAILFYKSARNSFDLPYIIAFLVLVIFSSFCEGQNIVGTLFAPFIVSIFTVNRSFVIFTYHKFWLIYTIIVGISMVVYALVLLGFSLPSVYIPPVNTLKDYFYQAYPFLLVANGDISDYFLSVFDEHGVVGTISLFFLFIERFNFKKLGNVIILLSGLLSLSLFFYVLIFVLLLYSTFAKGKIVKINKYVVIGIVALGVYAVFNNEVANEKILHRLEINNDQNRRFVGDNRAHEDLKMEVERMQGTTEYFFGTRNKNVREIAKSSSSYQNIIVRYGLIVLLAYILFFFLYSKHYIKDKRKVLMYMVFLLVSLYNRPYIFNVAYLYLFTLGVYAYSKRLELLFSKP